jgi:hypothetical protein
MAKSEDQVRTWAENDSDLDSLRSEESFRRLFAR